MKNTKQVYTERNKILRDQGFMTYKEFLESDTWKTLKQKISIDFGTLECCFCKNKQNIHIHHLKYKKKNLLKNKVSGLLPVCGVCHQSIHNIERQFDIDPYRATRVFQIIYYPSYEKFNWEKVTKKFKKRQNSLVIVRSSGLPAVLHHSLHASGARDAVVVDVFMKEYIENKLRKKDELLIRLYYQYEDKIKDFVKSLIKERVDEIFG